MTTAISGQAALSILENATKMQNEGAPSKPPSAVASVTQTWMITLSQAAQAGIDAAASGRSALGAESIARFASRFPTREGFPIDALAEAVLDPAAQSSSAGKSGAALAADARATLDAKYAALAATGQPFSEMGVSGGENLNALLGEFDRRSLNAISTNAEGLFTESEQLFASRTLTVEFQMSVADHQPYLPWQDNDYDEANVLRDRYAIQWLDQVSPEEKTTAQWAYERLYYEASYEGHLADASPAVLTESGVALQIGPQGDGIGWDYHSDNPVVRLMQEVRDYWRTHTFVDDMKGQGPIRSAEDIKNLSWMEPVRDRVDAAFAEARKMYGV